MGTPKLMQDLESAHRVEVARISKAGEMKIAKVMVQWVRFGNRGRVDTLRLLLCTLCR